VLLENAWIIPGLTFASFWLILFFGKRLPRGGSEIGIAAVGLAFVLACGMVVQWADRPADLIVEHGGGEHAEEEGEHSESEGGGAEQGGDHAEEEEEEEGEHEEALAAGLAPPGGVDVVPAAAAAEGEEPEGIRDAVVRNHTWFEVGDVKVTVGTFVDGFTVVMLFVVSLISLLVHVFSTNYLHGDVRFTHYFAALSLFTTGMFLLVVSSSTLQLLFGWELMGLCSFMLIGHWWEKQENSNAALKAFLTTRTGDIGLLVGICTLFFAAGQTFDMNEINFAALEGGIGETALLVGALGAVHRGHRQVGAVPAAHLAARRHGRARRRSPPSSTPPPWSWPASTWWPASTASSGRASTSAPVAPTPSRSSAASRWSSPPCSPSCSATSRRCSPTRP
jgi:NADH-quinone oxidoreductase subunit L